MNVRVKKFNLYKLGVVTLSIVVLFLCGWIWIPISYQADDNAAYNRFADSIWFEFKDVTGIGYHEGVSRRDPSDIIKDGDRYYIWYTKIPASKDGNGTPLYNSGYYGTIWYATSTDGYSWTEKGEALGPGMAGTFDSHAVFTPNILVYHGKYYLYYTGVKPTPGNPGNAFENNDETDITALGIAVADNPDGPFERIENNPVLEVSHVAAAFDSYRIDDAALWVKNDRIWLYYKGRSRIHGKSGPRHTQMGVAFAARADGPYTKHSTPLLDKSHEVLIWDQEEGIGSLTSLDRSLNLATDGLNFSAVQKDLVQFPQAPGLYRQQLVDHSIKEFPDWGISHGSKNGDIYLQRFTISSK